MGPYFWADLVRELLMALAGATFVASAIEGWQHFRAWRAGKWRRGLGVALVRAGICIGTISIVVGVATRIGEPLLPSTVGLVVAFVISLAGLVWLMRDDLDRL